MARGGGGGGHSGRSFGGSHSGRSFSGGGGRSSSFGGGRSSSFGGGFSRGPSHHSSYYGRPTRRVYYGSRGSSPCGCMFGFLIFAMIFIGGLFSALGGSLGSNITKSNEKREKMDTSNTTYSNTWFVD